MINPWHDLPAGPNPPEQVTAIIEIPAKSRNKYELCKDTGLLRLDRVLYSAVHYPGDYGFIPRTLHEDNDPLHHDYFDIADLPAHYLKEVEHFFQIYKDLEGKRVEILGWESAAAARRIIEESVVRYEERFVTAGP